jgi:hypothetical protein
MSSLSTVPMVPGMRSSEEDVCRRVCHELERGHDPEIMRHFGVSFSALLYRLASRTVKQLNAQARDSVAAEACVICPARRE